jgi:hypothetical protein
VVPSFAPAKDGQSVGHKIDRQSFRHVRSVGRGMTRSHHGNAGLGQNLRVTTDIKHEKAGRRFA